MLQNTNAVGAVAVAALLVLAGCAGSVPGGSGPSDTTGSQTTTDGTGTVQFYISDERNAIDQFEHLNVTVTKVGVHRVGGVNATTDDGAETATESNGTAANTTATSTTETEESEDTDEAESGDGEWVEYEANRTVDLTELQGANATEFGTFAAPNGTYDKVFVYVSEIDGTLKTGEEVNVKLPSSKLQLKTTFTVGDGETTQFVFDMTVFEAGNSGKYILKPVVSESGTSDEVEIEERPEAAGGPNAAANGDDDAEDEETPTVTTGNESSDTGASDRGNAPDGERGNASAGESTATDDTYSVVTARLPAASVDVPSVADAHLPGLPSLPSVSVGLEVASELPGPSAFGAAPGGPPEGVGPAA